MGVHWGELIAGRPRGAGVRARDARLVLHFSETAQPLRARQAGDCAQLRRLVAAGRSLYEILCVNRAIFNPYDAEKHLQVVRELAYGKILASQKNYVVAP